LAPDSSDLGSAVDPEAFVSDDESHADGDRSRMGFLEHLDELRRRLIYSVYALLASCALTFYFWKDLYSYLIKYFQANGGTLIYTEPLSGFMFSLKIGVLSGALLASPFIFSQLWLFVAPGLYTREKRIVIPFVVCSTILFLSGAWFAHAIAYPAMWKFFASYQQDGLQFFPTLDVTFSFYVKMMLGLGLVFEMPMLVFFLARFGIVSAGFLLKKMRYAILIIFILAAVITPTPDPVNQCIFAAPMIILYGISIGVAWVFGKKKPKDE
jgi:sec-independent protein translocase protein TatC